MLDIDVNELRVGLRVRRERQLPRAEIFISDALENGAGYSTYLAQQEVLHELFSRIGPDSKPGTRGAQWAGHTQAGKICDSSCHDCLRDYSNMRFHGLLDWRLALDMADIASCRPLLEQRWLSRAVDVREHLCEGFGWRPAEFGGIPSIIRDDDGLIQLLSHPLWDMLPQFMAPSLAIAYDEALHSPGGYKVEAVSLFDAIRRPGLLA
jgi:DEAD/DEAH box helicase domain-containing protein